jgi:molecular chaperone GrpE
MEASEPNKDEVAGDLQSELDRLKDELRQEHEMHLRALADFDNYRRRIERERSDVARSAKRDLVLSLLDVIDNFERALEHVGDEPSSMSEGLQAIYRKMLRLLEAQGITPLESRGEKFDPELHDAVASVQSEEHEPGTIADELQRGYRWGNQVLRPARVRVAV